MTIKISKSLLIEMYESIKALSKESKKVKETKEQLAKQVKTFGDLVSSDTQKVSEFAQLEKQLVIGFLQPMLVLMQRTDSAKVVEICIRQLISILEQTNILSEIQPKEIEASYVIYINLSSMIVILTNKYQEYFSGKADMLCCQLYSSILLHNNDVHLDEMKIIFSQLNRIYINCPISTQQSRDIEHIITLQIQVLQQRYAVSKVQNQNQNQVLQPPAFYDNQLFENIYYTDYKNYMNSVIDTLSNINKYQGNKCSIEQLVINIGYGIDFNQAEYFQKLIDQALDNIYWMLKLISLPALYDQTIKLLLDRLYLEMTEFTIQSQNAKQQEMCLVNIEKFIKTTLNYQSNQFIFEHFNNFIIKTLTAKDIPYYQFKATILAHVIRLICCDVSDQQMDEQRVQDFNQAVKQYNIIDYCNLKNCTEKEQLQYFQLLQRILMPPGMMLRILYVNFDAQFTQPDLVKKLVSAIVEQYQLQIKEQQQHSLETEIVLQKQYHKHTADMIKIILQSVDASKQFSTDLNKFAHACGILDCNDQKYLNYEYEADAKFRGIKFSNYQASLLSTMARLQSELSTNFLIYLYNADDVKFQFDFGCSTSNQQIENIEQKLKQKQKMEIGYQSFDEAPLKAMDHFRQMNYVDKLIPTTETITLSDELEQALVKDKDSQVQDQDDKAKKKRRNFEEEYTHNLALVAQNLKQFSNGSSAFEQIIDFLVKYAKKCEFSVGLSKIGFGELVGGAKVDNKCVLYFFVQYFKKKHLSGPNISFVQVLREFLMYFKLPGEGQVIDRIVSFFSKAYADYSHLDHKTMHGLTYATIMLNTDLHNEAVQKDRRMTKESFIQNTKLIDYAKQLTNEMLESIYNEINEKPFTLGSIEELKRFCYIIAKYVNVDEKVDQQKQNQNQIPQTQEKTQELDKETEYIKSLPRSQRYAKAFSEWVFFGFSQSKENKSDYLLEPMNIFYTFSEGLFSAMVEQHGQENVKYLLESIRGGVANVQAALKLNLLLMMSKRLNLPKLAKAHVSMYIQSSRFLQIPVFQFEKYQNNKISLQVINSGEKQSQIPDNYQLCKEEIELIEFLVYVVYQRMIPEKSIQQCYSNQLQILDSWTHITEVFSRIKYYDVLSQQQLISDKRNELNNKNKNYGILDYINALQQDIMLSYTVQNTNRIRPEVQPVNIENLMRICSQLYASDSFTKAEKVLSNSHLLQKEELMFLTKAYSQQSLNEIKISLIPDYAIYSVKHLNTLFMHLIEYDLALFEECFQNSLDHYSKLFALSNAFVAEEGFTLIAQVIGSFLQKALRSTQTQEQLILHLKDDQRIWKDIFSPLNFVVFDCDLNMAHSIINKILGYLQYIDFNSENYQTFLNYVYDDKEISNDNFNELQKLYYSVFNFCALPRVTILYIMSLAKQVIPQIIEISRSKISQDVSLTLKNRQKTASQEIYNCMKDCSLVVNKLSQIAISMFLVFNQSKVQLESMHKDLIINCLTLQNLLRQQIAVADISEAVQQQSFQFIRCISRIIIKTNKVQTDDSYPNIIMIVNRIGETLDIVCTDSKDDFDFRMNGIKLTQDYITEILKINCGRNLVQKIIEATINKLIPNFVRQERLDSIKCNNLEAQKFICDCGQQKFHCPLEYILDLLIPKDNEVDKLKLTIIEQTFSSLFKYLLDYHATSILNITKYLLSRLLDLDFNFVMQTLIKVQQDAYELKNNISQKNIEYYTEITTLFLISVLKYNIQSNTCQALQHCCIVNLQLLEIATNDCIDKVLEQVLLIYQQSAYDIQNNKKVAQSVVMMLKSFIPKYYLKQSQVIKCIEFIDNMNQEIFATHFKKQVFESFTKLMINGSAEIRQKLLELLLKQYKPVEQDEK